MNPSHPPVRIGTASWGIPTAFRTNFPSGDSLLERYSQVFNIVEINSSFYRPHKKKTYEKWVTMTPKDFQFSVKMPKEITHKHRLVDTDSQLSHFLDEVSGLQDKLGPILIQLPPSLQFEPTAATNFFRLLRTKFAGNVALEARHASWTSAKSTALISENNIVQVLADPAVIDVKTRRNAPFQYYRLHGSPEIYSSSYPTSFLGNLCKNLQPSSIVIFDNTILGAATQNALELKAKVESFS